MKKWKTKCNGKIVKHGAKGYKIAPGTKKGDRYCARSEGIRKKFKQNCNGNDKCAPNCLSRKKWKCKEKKSLK